MSKQRGRKTFQHPGTKHVVTTGLPTEQTELRGRGYPRVKLGEPAGGGGVEG